MTLEEMGEVARETGVELNFPSTMIELPRACVTADQLPALQTFLLWNQRPHPDNIRFQPDDGGKISSYVGKKFFPKIPLPFWTEQVWEPGCPGCQAGTENQADVKNGYLR